MTLGIEILGRWAVGALTVEDDAYYYLIVARNIAAYGMSSFDLQSPTNGYHPLWLGLMVLQDLTIGPSLLATAVLQAVLLAGGCFFILLAAPVRNGAAQAFFAVIFTLLIGRFGLGGMEAALVVFCAGAMIVAMRGASGGGATRGAWLGLAGAACVGARLDSAVFVIPALAATATTPRARAAAFVVIGGLGALYLAANLWAFGTAAPVSSAVKSLGGLQINHPVLAQLAAALTLGGHGLSYLLTLAALAAAAILIRASKPRTPARALAWASSIGGALYVAKIVFLSSWVVWPWYNYAIIFPLSAAFLALSPPAQALANKDYRRAAGRFIPLATLGVMVVASIVAAARSRGPSNDFAAINRMAVQRFGGVLGGARVAMGDRAGSFAAAYPGPVVQLEGLVNDKTYFHTLSRGGDIRGLLCQRDVRFILAYEPELGGYNHFSIPLLRPALTQFHGPRLDVWREDEIGRLRDISLYNSRRDRGTGDDTLYVWRLRCGPRAG